METLEVQPESQHDSYCEAPAHGLRAVSVFRPATELIVENESIQPIEINGKELRSDTGRLSEQITIAESKDDTAK